MVKYLIKKGEVNSLKKKVKVLVKKPKKAKGTIKGTLGRMSRELKDKQMKSAKSLLDTLKEN